MKRITPFILILLGILLLTYALNKKHHQKQNHLFSVPTTPQSHSHSLQGSQQRNIPNAPRKKSTAASLKTNQYFKQARAQKNHIAAMGYLLKQYSSPHFSLNDVIHDLEQKKMEPQLLEETNPYTGTMYVLRTESPLPNTRYFHAQYFENNNKEPFLQHMSFDIKPTQNAFQNAVRTIQSVFQNLKPPTINKPGFIVWPWKDGYNIWIQKMSQEQLSGDPYNAYDSNDLGTIKIALEMDVHHEHIH